MGYPEPRAVPRYTVDDVSLLFPAETLFGYIFGHYVPFMNSGALGQVPQVQYKDKKEGKLFNRDRMTASGSARDYGAHYLHS